MDKPDKKPEADREGLRLAYLAGVEDTQAGYPYWCAEGSKDRINDLINDGLLEHLEKDGQNEER